MNTHKRASTFDMRNESATRAKHIIMYKAALTRIDAKPTMRAITSDNMWNESATRAMELVT